MNNIENENTMIYPYCYKIKRGCPPHIPCKQNKDEEKCIKALAEYMAMLENPLRERNEIGKDKLVEKFIALKECLKKYGDIYAKLNFILYVNDNTREVIFPSQTQIQSKLNEFLRDLGYNIIQDYSYKIKLFNILLNDKMREIYNRLYSEPGFAEKESLEPKQYGIDKLINKKKRVTFEARGLKKKTKTKKSRRKRIMYKTRKN